MMRLYYGKLEIGFFMFFTFWVSSDSSVRNFACLVQKSVEKYFAKFTTLKQIFQLLHTVF